MLGHASNLREFKRFYGCPVEFRASSDCLEFSARTLALPLVTEDQILLETLKPICDAASRERGTRKGTLRALVENEVQRALPNGDIRKPSIAKALGISARTLSRRLADEGVTYAEVVDDLRRTLALQYLKDPSISLSQIAWLLGYEGSTSFNHAFGRWTGRSLPRYGERDGSGLVRVRWFYACTLYRLAEACWSRRSRPTCSRLRTRKRRPPLRSGVRIQ